MRTWIGRTRRVTGAGAVSALGLTALLAAAPSDIVPGSGTPVADAAMERDAETVRSLLKQGFDVNAAQGDGMSALHWAATNGDVETAKMLLYAGANTKATTRLGNFTPLFLAAKVGSAPVVETLLEAGADANVATVNGTTPLMMAAASGSVDAVAELLDHGAEIDAKESSKAQTPLMFAAAYGRTPVVELLAERGADPSLATTSVDVTALDKDYTDVRREHLKELGVIAQGAGGRASREEEERARKEKEKAKGEASSGSGNVFAKMFGWLPGVGEDAAAETKGDAKKEDGPKRLSYSDLVGSRGGLAPLHFAARQGHLDTVKALLAAGSDIDQVTADHTSPLLIATINGQFDIGKYLLEQGADPNLASDAGSTPLYATINLQWAPKSLYPQPRAHLQQRLTYLEYMEALLQAGANPNARLEKKIWYSGFNFDLSGVDESGATPFWRAAYGADVDAMKLLVRYGADPNVPTVKPPGRPQTGDDTREIEDVSGLPPVPVGGPGVPPLQAAAGVGYGEGFAANSHRFHPAGMLHAVKYLVEELGADVNARDHEGNTALHHAAARGDNDMILFLVEHGADVTLVNREGQTTADMANGPVQRVQPFPETVALLEKLGSKNNHKCVSC